MLNDNQKKVLVLDSQGKTLREIAEIVHMSVSGVKGALKRGKNNLDQSIEDLEFAIKNSLLDDRQIGVVKRIINELL